VWTPDELRRFGEICLDNGVLVMSDEIHGDLTAHGHTFTPFASLGESLAQNAVVCTAPSKTFNLAGLQVSNLIIANSEIRARFQRTLENDGLFGINTFGLVALQAAYTHGEDWLWQALDIWGATAASASIRGRAHPADHRVHRRPRIWCG
jgi:cystathionine beta-lyase